MNQLPVEYPKMLFGASLDANITVLSDAEEQLARAKGYGSLEERSDYVDGEVVFKPMADPTPTPAPAPVPLPTSQFTAL